MVTCNTNPYQMRTISKEYYPFRWEIILFMGAVHLLALASLPFVSVPNLVACLILYSLIVLFRWGTVTGLSDATPGGDATQKGVTQLRLVLAARL